VTTGRDPGHHLFHDFMQNNASNRIELLAPAGNFEKLEIVLHYGADAVYLAGKDFSLRNFSGNFSLDEIEAAVELVHTYGARAYVAVNIYARPGDLTAIERYIHQLKALAPDGLIAADPAIVAMIRNIAPAIPLHLSTQANTTNDAAVRFWRAQGVRRINAARELSLAEIARLAAVPQMEIEAFVHGAMCISYSGRCLLSNHMAHRPSNQGMCCQPCRFKYAVMEETRPGQYFPLAEDEQGTYIFNSRDLCMLEHLPSMIGSGVRALKIEGRMKGIHYAATAVKIYREAIDAYRSDPGGYIPKPYWSAELNKITSRGYCTGFYLGDPNQTAPALALTQPHPHVLAGKVLSTAGRHKAYIEVRNQLRQGDRVEIIKHRGPGIPARILSISDNEGQPVTIVHPAARATVTLNADCQRFDLLRLDSSIEATESAALDKV
jgi:putative protease